MSCLNWRLPGGKRNLKWITSCSGVVSETLLTSVLQSISSSFPPGTNFPLNLAPCPCSPSTPSQGRHWSCFQQYGQAEFEPCNHDDLSLGLSAHSYHPHCQVVISFNIIFTSRSTNVLYKWYSLTFSSSFSLPTKYSYNILSCGLEMQLSGRELV